MSFDIYLNTQKCDQCGRGEERAWSVNLTHNVNSIVDACLVAGGATKAAVKTEAYPERSWGRLNGWTAVGAAAILSSALDVANDPAREEEFRAMEPSNGWGDLDVVRRVMREFLDACRAQPMTVVSTWG